jgi:polysaccharide deacetylase family protein (PEP-CTERM system associated)
MTLIMAHHLFTVDVEEYFQVAALEPYAPRERWMSFPKRVELGIDRLLEVLDRHHASATFFVLGSLAEWNPGVVRRIAAAGHEVASHGWSHRRVTSLTPDDFRAEIVRSRALLSDLAGHPVKGFRAPNFSIRLNCDWAFDALLEAGYQYDASVFPGRASGKDYRGEGIQVFQRAGGAILEVPLSCATFAGLRIPAGGGAWFRLLPYSLTARALRQAGERGAPGVFYIHPWELDAEQPRLRTSVLTRMRHYGGLNRVRPRLERLLSEFQFTSIEKWLSRNVRLSDHLLTSRKSANSDGIVNAKVRSKP